MAAQEQVEALIANAIEISGSASEQAEAIANGAQSAATSSLSLPVPVVRAPDIPEIPPFNPNQDLGIEFEEGYDAAIADWDPDFQAQITDWINRYFPSVEACVRTATDNWICDRLTTGGTGLPASVEDALWQRSREREVLEAQRQIGEAIEGTAARGWGLPIGTLVDSVNRIQQDAANKASGHSRDVAIKRFETLIQNQRLAAELGVRLRLGVVSALNDYLRAWTDLRKAAIDKAKAIVDAKVKLWDQASAYYRATIEAADLELRIEALGVDAEIRTNETFVQHAVGSLQARVQAAIGAVDALARIAASALSANSSMASLENVTYEQPE
jgi:hypothetical protein